MRPDGDSEPDDYGLPRVDVVVPDDARELDREVVAYQRERRQRRRRERARRLLRPVTRFGLAIPIIAGALLVALLSGALMTTFGPQPTSRPTTALLAPNPSEPPGKINGVLPGGEVTRATGKAVRTSLTDLRPGVIAIIPPGYRCEDVVAELAGRTQEFKLNFWLVADPRPSGGHKGLPVKELAACAGTSHRGAPQIIEDPSALLAGAYAPAPSPAASSTPSPSSSSGGGTPGNAPPSNSPPPSSGPGGTAGSGLTAVFVRPDGVVIDVVHGPKAGSELTNKVKSLESG